MKRLVRTVELVFFEDNANGEYGLAHKETYDQNQGNGFNAFWNGIGIFHDVFEHSHEFTNKYFRGDYALNVGGEMTAMGAMYYYIDEMGVHNRLREGTSWRGHGEIMRESTLSEVHEAISSGYCNYGYTLESNVPKQKPVENGEFEYQLEAYARRVKELPLSDYDQQEKEFGRNYKQSVTFRKIADLHRYGYRMAEKLVPNSHDNYATLCTFIEFWNVFCKRNAAEDMQRNFRGLTVKVYRDENGLIDWKGVFHSADKYAVKDVVIKSDRNPEHFSIEDYWILDNE
jgi:hypothetical protein